MKPRLIQSRGREVLLLGPGGGGVKETGNYLIYILFICLFLAVLDLPCCEHFSLAAGEGGTTIQGSAWACHCGGFLCCGALALGERTSVVAARWAQ